MSFKITSRQAAFGDYIIYKTILRDASGVFEKSPIKVAGISAGRIKKIQLFDDKALVVFEVLKEVKVTQGSELQVKTVGLLGEKYIDILLGGEDNFRLPEDSIIPSIESGGFENIAKELSDILSDMRDIIHNIKVSIAPEHDGDEFPIRSIIYALKEMTESLSYELDSNNRDSLMAGIKKVSPAIDDVKYAMEDLRAIMEKIRKGQGTLGKLISDEEVIDQVTQTLSGVNRLVNRVDSIQTELNIFTAANSVQNNITELSLDISPSPERFYRVGVVTSDFGIENQKEVRTSVAGGPVTLTETTEVEKGGYLFNAMIGRKVNNWNFRVGLLESSGGLGIDYYLASQNFKLSLDLFDYREAIGPQMRLGLNFHLWNVFYGKIAGEDVLTDKGHRSLSLGAGFRFTDEDLKGLVAFFF